MIDWQPKGPKSSCYCGQETEQATVLAVSSCSVTLLPSETSPPGSSVSMLSQLWFDLKRVHQGMQFVLWFGYLSVSNWTEHVGYWMPIQCDLLEGNSASVGILIIQPSYKNWINLKTNKPHSRFIKGIIYNLRELPFRQLLVQILLFH